jgi:hypothetical protein
LVTSGEARIRDTHLFFTVLMTRKGHLLRATC